jgi:hypothetical protein
VNATAGDLLANYLSGDATKTRSPMFLETLAVRPSWRAPMIYFPMLWPVVTLLSRLENRALAAVGA